jgi:hypothetical protein
MRVSAIVGGALLGVALSACALEASAAPKRAAPAAQKKGRAPAARPKPEPAPDASAEPSSETEKTPYGAPPEDPPTNSSNVDLTIAAGNVYTLDEPPPTTSDKPSGPKPSPLTPEPGEMPAKAAPPGPNGLDQLMADIATLRARVAALTTSLFSSKLRVSVHTEGDDARVTAFVVTLDDGVVFRGDAGFVADDQKVVYEHAVAPGSHVIGIEIERQDARGPAFRTWQTTRCAIRVPERKTLDATVVLDDDSDMGSDFPDDQDGEYELGVRLRAKVRD